MGGRMEGIVLEGMLRDQVWVVVVGEGEYGWISIFSSKEKARVLYDNQKDRYECYMYRRTINNPSPEEYT